MEGREGRVPLTEPLVPIIEGKILVGRGGGGRGGNKSTNGDDNMVAS